MKQHALSSIFPSLPADELKTLADDIKAHGMHSSIVLYKGDVLDGWHRYQACNIAGVYPRTIDYKGSDPVAFVRSANWHRRHLSASQRAFSQVQLSEWATEGKRLDTKPNGLVKTESEMAAEAKVGVKTIARAKRVAKSGSKALKKAVKDGKITVDKAAEIANLPIKEQAAAIKAAEIKAPPEPQYTPLDAAHDQIGELQIALAIAHMVGSEKDKDQATDLIVELRAEIKTLTETLKAVTISRDTLMNENAALKRHNVSLQKKIDKK